MSAQMTPESATQLPSVERPYESMPFNLLVEQLELQYNDGDVSFEILSELIRRAEVAEHSHL